LNHILDYLRRGEIFTSFFTGILTACGSLGGTKTTTTVGVTWDGGMTAGATRITDDGTAKNTVSASPDGTKLLYTEATKKDSNGNWIWNITYLGDANSPVKTPLITDDAFEPSWYGDNTQFLYISYEGGSGKIVRSGVQGGGKTYITRAAVRDPCWGANNEIFCIVDTGDIQEIYKLRLRAD
jgi:Tol biopolymer transport system component